MSTSVYSTSFSSYGTKQEQLPFLRKSPLALPKTMLMNYYSFAYSTIPIFPLFIQICTVFRELQMIIPAMFLSSENFYPKGEIIHDVANFLSFFTRIIPVGYGIECFRVLDWILFAIFLIDFLITIISIFNFSRRSELPKFCSYYIAIYDIAINNIIKPVLLSCATYLIASNRRSTLDLTISIFLYILFGLNAFIEFASSATSLYFYPHPFPSIFQYPHSYLNLFVPILSLISELYALVDFPYSKIVFPVFMIILYIVILFLMTYVAILINKWVVCSFSATCFTGILISCVSIVFHYVKISVPLYCPLIYILVWTILYILFTIVYDKLTIRNLKILDDMEQDPKEVITHLSQFKLMHIITVGFVNSHNYCISFAILQDATEHFPKSYLIHVLYSKFYAIYPGENLQLKLALSKIKQCDCSKYVKKYLTYQINALLMKRDNSLSVALKKKMHSIQTLINSAKLRIRNALESSKNGNSSKLLPLFSKATSIIDQTNLRLANLRSYHRYNRYALLLQASYTKDVLADYKLAESLKEAARLVQSDKFSTIDQPYLYGRLYFPNLPPKLSMSATQISNHSTNNNNTDTQNHSSICSEFRDDGNFDYSPEQISLHTQLKSSIDSLSIPSIRHSIIFVVGNFLILVIFAFLLNTIFLLPTISDSISSPSKYLDVITLARSNSMNAFASLIRYRIELTENTTTQCYTDNEISPQIGGECDAKSQLIYFGQKSLAYLTNLPILQLSRSSNKYLKQAQMMMFRTELQFRDFYDWENYTNVNRSPFLELMFLVENCIIIGTNERNKYEIRSKYFANVIRNYLTLILYIQDICDLLTEFLNSQVNHLRSIFHTVQIASIIILPILNLCFITFYAIWISRNQHVVFNSFTSLPKPTIDKIIQQLEVVQRNTSFTQPKEHAQINYDTIESGLSGSGSGGSGSGGSYDASEKSAQKDKIISLFHTSQNDFYNHNVIIIVAILVVLTFCECLFLYFTLSIYINGADSFIKSTPHIQTITTTLVDIQELAITLSMHSNANHHLSYVIQTHNQSFNQFYEECSTNFHIFYFGNLSMNYDPIITSTKSLFESFLREPHFKADTTQLYEFYSVLPYDFMFYYVMDLLRTLYVTTLQSNNPLSPTNTYLSHIWNIILVYLYPDFFYPLYKMFTSEVSQLITKKFPLYYTLSSIIVVVSACLFAGAIYIFVKIKKQLLSVLRLLLLAPSNVIIQSRYIMLLLSGTFHIPQQSLTSLDDYSFSKVLKDYPDGLIKCDKDGKIISMNKVAKKLFNQFGEIKQINYNQLKERIEIENKVLEKSVFTQGDNVFIILTDVTIENEYQKQLKEMEEKREYYLKFILPTAVTEYKDNGHSNNLSFHTSKATIVSFSIKSAILPLTDKPENNNAVSNPNDQNGQFSDMNVNCDTFRKIFEYMKSLQSVYPAAEYIDVHLEDVIVVSRLFTKIQTDVAANQLLCFAIDVLNFCKSLKSNENTELIVKAGMISGGPIAAGVINYNDVPHFEVISVFVDYAKSMARFAPNFSIHIHRSSYDYVYASGYDLKETKGVNIPSLGSIVTYIVNV